MLKQLENRTRTSRNITGSVANAINQAATAEVIAQSDTKTRSTTNIAGTVVTEANPIQLSFFNLDDPLLEELRDELKKIDINTMSPLDAFDKLRSLKKRLGL